MTPWSLTQPYEKKPGSRYNLFNFYIKNSHEIYSIPRQTNYLTCESRVQMKEMVMKKTQFFVWNSLFDWRNLFQSNSTENFVSSAVSMAPLSLTPRCQVKDNAELDSTVSMTLPSLTLPCQRQCWAWPNGVNDNNEFDSAMSKAMLSLTPGCQWHRRVFCTCKYSNTVSS